MLSPFSWGQFFTAIGIGLVLYYGWVIRRFYRHDWRGVPRGRGEDAVKPNENGKKTDTNGADGTRAEGAAVQPDHFATKDLAGPKTRDEL